MIMRIDKDPVLIRLGKTALLILVVISFPLSAWYVVHTGNEQDKQLCEESRARYNVIARIIDQVASESDNPDALKPYYKILGTRPDC